MKQFFVVNGEKLKAPYKYILYTTYGYNGCYYSESASNVLSNMNDNKTVNVVNMINSSDKNELSNILKKNTNINDNYNTWPRVYYRGNFIGGYSELMEHLQKKSN